MRWFGAVYNVLVSMAGARESERSQFVALHARFSPPCDEYRFGGELGFGGKYWRETNEVTCYHEDENAHRLKIIADVNAALLRLKNERE